MSNLLIEACQKVGIALKLAQPTTHTSFVTDFWEFEVIIERVQLGETKEFTVRFAKRKSGREEQIVFYEKKFSSKEQALKKLCDEDGNIKKYLIQCLKNKNVVRPQEE